ncbi:MAG: hypothetical protein R3D98_02790 [Candidatus Krumholzibacteriia bacterium]
MPLLRNVWLLLVGLLTIVVGYILLADNRLSLGPVLLVAGYCVVLPLFVWRLFRRGVGE